MLKTLALILLLAVPQDLPEYGSLSELKGKQRVFVVADSTDARGLIIKGLSKSTLKTVDSPDDAEFFLEYRVIRTGEHPGPMGSRSYLVSEMTAYVKNERKRILWSENESNAGTIVPNENHLTRHFLKALKRAVK